MAADPTEPPHRLSLPRALLRGVWLGLFVCLVLLLVHVFVGANLHTVIPGHVYRSAQLTEANLDKFVKRLGIKTVVNLRGFCGGQPWFDEECQAASRAGISLEVLGFSAGHLPAISEIHRLVEVVERSEYPLLFHCYRGVDRTGLATVLTLLLKTDTPLKEARRSLGLRYIHLPFGRTGHLDRFFDYYEDWLEQQGADHSPERFRHWVLKEYRGGANRGWAELLGHVLIGPERKRLPGPRGGLPPGPNERLHVKVPLRVPLGIPVRFHNTSSETWVFHPHDTTGVHAFCRVIDENGRMGYFARAGRFHARVPPGESIELVLPLPSVPARGTYHLQIGLLEEQHCFFQEVGLELLNLDLEAS